MGKGLCAFLVGKNIKFDIEMELDAKWKSRFPCRSLSKSSKSVAVVQIHAGYVDLGGMVLMGSTKSSSQLPNPWLCRLALLFGRLDNPIYCLDFFESICKDAQLQRFACQLMHKVGLYLERCMT